MNRQILNTFAVTLAFGVGSMVTALVLDISAVRTYLGIGTMPAQELVQVGLAFVGIAACAGLAVDGLRLLAAKVWDRSRQMQHDMDTLFRSALA
jgi:hypothetical protein